jgi:uncharacterized GH25 family protein
MNRCLLALAGLIVAASAAQAHFIYVVPEANGTSAKVVFSDSLEPDENVPIDRIANTKLFCRDASGKATPLTMKKGDNAYTITFPAGDSQIIGGTCTYGVFQRGDAKPSLLVYHPKLIVGPVTASKAWDKLPLEIVPTGPGQFVFLKDGKPVADADINARLPGDKTEKLKTDVKGEFKLHTSATGLYGLWARFIEPKAGEQDGKKYEQTTHYATLVFRSGARADAGLPIKAVLEKGGDPEATKLLADARAARALWQHFPGFTADVEINWDGKLAKGKVKVDDAGNITVEGIDDKGMATWARRVLGSTVAHRLPSNRSLETPCAFADNEQHHPLGRLIDVLNDELHSSYRIRDRQIMVVNRTTPEGRFSIMMQENHTTPEGKFLPASFVVNYTDGATGSLTKSEASVHTWRRIGGIDLPVLNRVIIAGKENSVRDLTLSNHHLAQPSAAR